VHCAALCGGVPDASLKWLPRHRFLAFDWPHAHNTSHVILAAQSQDLAWKKLEQLPTYGQLSLCGAQRWHQRLNE
jgi:hypothetical protein